MLPIGKGGLWDGDGWGEVGMLAGTGRGEGQGRAGGLWWAVAGMTVLCAGRCYEGRGEREGRL